MENNPQKLATIDGFSINLSGQSVASKDFLEFTKQQLTSRDINPQKLPLKSPKRLQLRVYREHKSLYPKLSAMDVNSH